MKNSENISSFLSFLRDAQSGRSIAIDEQKEADMQTQDILHYLELNDVNLCEHAKLSAALQAIRRKRRNAKNTQEATEPVSEWMKDEKNRRAVKSLELSLGATRKAEGRIENRCYMNRTDIIEEILGTDRKMEEKTDDDESRKGEEGQQIDRESHGEDTQDGEIRKGVVSQ